MKSTSKYELKLKLGKDEYSSKGETVLEALEKLEKPTKIFTKGILSVEHEGKSKEMIFMPIMLRRMFFPSGMAIWAKKLSLFLK